MLRRDAMVAGAPAAWAAILYEARLPAVRGARRPSVSQEHVLSAAPTSWI